MILFLLQILAFAQLSRAEAGLALQPEIDRAFALILQTQIGQGVCANLLGADADALHVHLGVSIEAAQDFAKACAGAPAPQWVSATNPADIRKLTLKAKKPRRYRVVQVTQSHTIESWTDPFTNTTLILADRLPLSEERLIQILAHETAVYFDSKTTPAHPDAQLIPELQSLAIQSPSRIDPLLALSNPLTAHSLTYARALRVEFAIVSELVEKGLIKAPRDFRDPYLNHLISARCNHVCLEQLIVNMRPTYLPLSLAFLAFAPHYRNLMTHQLPKIQPFWTAAQWERAQHALHHLPVGFLKDRFSEDSLADLQGVFAAQQTEAANFYKVRVFLEEDLWPLEWVAISRGRVSDRQSLLEFMKIPLLSGYNISQSSGPRVRVRTGNIE